MSELTKRKVDISVKRLIELRGQYDSMSGFTADREQFYMFRNKVAALDTALAALDAVRWRDAKTEPPEPYEVCRTDRNELGYLDHHGVWWSSNAIKEGDYGKSVMPKVWLPLPKWED